MKKCILLLSLCTFGAHAQESSYHGDSLNYLPIELIGSISMFEPSKGWYYGAGLGVEIENEYHGSSEKAAEAEPFFELGYRGHGWMFQSNIFSNRLIYQVTDSVFLHGRFNHEEGRTEDDASNDILDGMGKIDSMLELGFGVSWQPMQRLTVSMLGQGYSGGNPDKGLVGFVAAHYRLVNQPNLKIDVRFDASFADADHLQTEFGVTEQQAITSIYPQYLFDSGLKSYGIGLKGVYVYSDQVFFTFGADYEWHSSKVSDSPLIQAGSNSETEASLGFIYKF